MTTDDERRIFEEHGWTFDQVQRVWLAPDGFRVSVDDLVLAADAMGPAVERRVLQVAREHGKR